MLLIWLGALLVVGGILYMAGHAIWRGRLSKSPSLPPAPPRGTLEPPARGVRFLGLGENWPGLALMVLGAILLLFGAAV